MKLKYRILIFFVIALIIIISVLLYFKIHKQNKERKIQEENKMLLEDIKSHYNHYVITNKDAILYTKQGESFIENGKISEGVNLTLKEEQLTIDTKYFYVEGLNLYIFYKDVNKSDEYKIDDRFKNYIYFNQNIITKDATNFYDKNDNYLYTINSSFDFKILVKEDNKYGVVYNNELLYIHDTDVDNIYENINTDLKNKVRIKTLTYHFIYNPLITKCDQSICQSLEQFESHLKYIKDNNYFSLKLNELEMYMDGKIQIPEKSIVLTIDDGYIDLDTIRLLEQYEVNATLFVITSWISIEQFQSEYLDLESHTHNMHNQYECAGYGNQGGGILCLPEEQVLEDLKTSQEILGGSEYFAYPFFDFNDRAIKLLKQANFKLAFIGQYDTDGYSYPNKTDKFKIRRKTIFSSTTMEEFVSYLQ